MRAYDEKQMRRARRMRRLRRLSALLGAALVLIAVYVLLTTSVTFDGQVETIGGQRNTNSILPPLGLLSIGVALLAFGLP